MFIPLTLKSIISALCVRWGSAPDARKPNNNTRYRIVDALLAAFSVFFMQSRSFLAHQRLLHSKKGRSNATSLFQITHIPSDPQIRNLLDRIPVKYFHTDFWTILDQAKAQGLLSQFQSELGTYLAAADGVTHFSSTNISCPHCLKRMDNQGKEHFYHSAITPVLVNPDQKRVFPLPPEFIVPQDGHEKQDCERAAIKRWLAQHHTHFADYTITYLGDDLYANQPLCSLIVDTYHQYFIFTCKEDSHVALYEWIATFEKTNTLSIQSVRHWNGKHGEIWRYRFVNQVPLRSGNDAIQVNWCELVITHEKTGEILYKNAFVTNHTITMSNIASIVRAGRTRWKIENENNNTLKNQGYHFEHNFGHGKQNLSNVLITLNLLAFLVHTVQELVSPAYQTLRQALGARITFFEDLRALTRYLVFDSWEVLFCFMLDGLEIPLHSP